jgi:DNA (cytosine-5)-methyltransferase 1
MAQNASGKAGHASTGDDLSILQVFADTGAETPALSRYGHVTRLGIDPTRNDTSDVIQADARHAPIADETHFDIGIAHPPCTKWSDMPDVDRDAAPNLIPTARDVCNSYCDNHIIENKPTAPLEDPTVLDGHMFELGIKWERAFETTFPVKQPPIQTRVTETTPFFYKERPVGWWAAVKGSKQKFGSRHLSKNTIPAAYLNYLFRHYYQAIGATETDYTDWGERKDKEASQAANNQLSDFDPQ